MAYPPALKLTAITRSYNSQVNRLDEVEEESRVVCHLVESKEGNCTGSQSFPTEKKEEMIKTCVILIYLVLVHSSRWPGRSPIGRHSPHDKHPHLATGM